MANSGLSSSSRSQLSCKDTSAPDQAEHVSENVSDSVWRIKRRIKRRQVESETQAESLLCQRVLDVDEKVGLLHPLHITSTCTPPRRRPSLRFKVCGVRRRTRALGRRDPVPCFARARTAALSELRAFSTGKSAFCSLPSSSKRLHHAFYCPAFHRQ